MFGICNKVPTVRCDFNSNSHLIYLKQQHQVSITMEDTFTSSANKVGKPVVYHKGMHSIFGPLSVATKICIEGTLSIKEKETILGGITQIHPWRNHYAVVVRDDCTLRIFKDHDQRSSQPRRPDEAFDLGQAVELEIVEDSGGRHPHRFDLRFGDKYVFSGNASTGSELKLWIDGLIQCCPAVYSKVFQEDIPVYIPPGMAIVPVNEPAAAVSAPPTPSKAQQPARVSDAFSSSSSSSTTSTGDVGLLVEAALKQAFDSKLKDFDVKLKPIHDAMTQHTDKLKTISEGIFLIPDQVTKRVDEGFVKAAALRGSIDGAAGGGRLSIDSTNLVSRNVTDSVLDALKSKLDIQNASNAAAAAALKTAVMEHLSGLNETVKRSLEKSTSLQQQQQQQTPTPLIVDSTPILNEVRSVLREQVSLLHKEATETSSLLTLQSDKAVASAASTAELVKELSKQVISSSAAVSASVETTKAIVEKNAAELREEVSRRIEDIRSNVATVVMKARDEDSVKSAAGQQQQLSILLRDLASSFAASSSAASSSFMREMQGDLTRDQNAALSGLSAEIKKDLKSVIDINKKELSLVSGLLDENLAAQKLSSDSLLSFSNKQLQSNTELSRLADEVGLQSGSMSHLSATLKEVQSNTLAVGDRSLAAVESIKAVGKSVETALEGSKAATLTQITTLAQALSSLKDLHNDEATSTRTVLSDGNQQLKESLHSLESSNSSIKEKVVDLTRAVETASVHNSASVNAVLAQMQSSLRSQESASSNLSSTVRECVRTSHDTLASGLSTQLGESLRSTRDTLLAQLNDALIREQRASDSRASITRDSLAEHSSKTSELSHRVAGLEAASSQVLSLCGRAEANTSKTADSVAQSKHVIDTVSSIVSSGVPLAKDSIEMLVSALLPRIVQSLSDRLSPEFSGIRDQLAVVESRLDKVSDIEKRLNGLVSEIEGKLKDHSRNITDKVSSSTSEAASSIDRRVIDFHVEAINQNGSFRSALEEISIRLSSFETLMPRIGSISEHLVKVDAKMSRIEALETRMSEHFSFLERIDQRTQHTHDLRAEAELKASVKASAAIAAAAAASVSSSPFNNNALNSSRLFSQSASSSSSSSSSAPMTTNLSSPLPSTTSSFDGNAPAFIAQMRALRLQSATLQGELSRLTGGAFPAGGGGRIPAEIRERPEVGAVLLRLELVENMISETRKAMGARGESPYAVSFI